MKTMSTLTYSQKGDYLYPNLAVSQKEPRSLGKYGLMRAKYLKEYQPLLRGELLMAGQLNEHLAQMDSEAREMVEQLTEQMAAGISLPDRKTQPLEWAQQMSMLKAQAEEVVLAELIYA